ncbi:MAG: DNA-binding response regulator, partial [Paenibacillus sp.]|nr:DNA-binding response regulator [Paenibacillus sp.]
MAKVLIVDDDPYIRELVRFYLRGEGFAVMEASNGLEALELLKRTLADLVVLDIMMPQMDGWELCRRLAAEFPDIPLLMLTAKG